MKKRVISFILCLCTIVALMPTSAFAASLISIIRPTVTAPALGQKPSYTATLPSTASTEVKNVAWSGELDSSGCFQADVAYTVRVTVAVQAGQDKIISTTASKNILVNGKQAKLESVSSDQKQAVVAYTFPALTASSSTLNTIAIHFPDPVVGATPPDASQTSVSSNSAYVKEVEWVSDYDGDVFVDNKDFTVYVTVAIKDGVNAQFKLSNPTINGSAAKIESISGDNREVVLSAKYTSKTEAPTAHTQFTIKFPEPTVGSTPPSASTATVSVSSAYVKDVEWVSDYDGDVFVENKDFTVFVTIAVRKGYADLLDPKKVTINGVTAKIESVSADKKEFVVSTEYTSKSTSPTAITKLNLTVPSPVAGYLPASHTEAGGCPSSAQVTKFVWYGVSQGSHFLNEKEYSIDITLKIRSGYDSYFDLNKVTVNGAAAKVKSVSSDGKQAVISYTFPVTDKYTGAVNRVARTITAPSVGATPATTTTADSNASTMVKKVEWVGALDSNGKFAAGESYTVKLTIVMKPEYEKKVFNLTDITINGKDAKLVSISSDKKEIVISYTFPKLAASSTVNSVAITFPDLKVGSTPPNASQTKISNSSTYIKEVEWISDYDGDVFTDNKDYTVYVTVGIKDGVNAVFDVKTATIDGDAAKIESISANKKEIILSTEFTSKTTPAFTDVPHKEWFYSFVSKVCDAGWMTGSGGGKFNPTGNLSLAEVMVLASRIHSDHTKNDIPSAGGAWYMSFYSYCQNHGLLNGMNISEKDMNRPATRYEMVAILDRAAHRDQTAGGVNTVKDGFIPDVKENDTYGEVVYRWYRSGIVTGDSARRFNGNNNITRAEVSVILCQLLELVDRAKI